MWIGGLRATWTDFLPASMRGTKKYLRMPTVVSNFRTHVLPLRRVLNFVGLVNSGAYVCHMHYIFYSFCFVHCVYYILTGEHTLCVLFKLARALSRPAWPTPFPSTHTRALRDRVSNPLSHPPPSRSLSLRQ
jgi:hypothetical protein